MHVAGSTPYPWPFDGRFDEAGTALLLVGPTDPAAQDAGTHAVVSAMVAAATAAGVPVISVATAAPEGTRRRGAGPASDARSRDRPGHHLTARGVDAFYGSDLELVLTGHRARRLVLAGSALELSVHSTMRSANDRGFECLLVLDACTALDPALTPSSRSMVEASGGIFGAVGQAADVVAAWGAVPPAWAPDTTTSSVTQGAPR
ncbi:cysteine hydrolase family protein [Cellulomonas aerilata]|uniref:Cysteine hydrolase n=1 Tax=Cellulomonas aerilata TaxID=515326 RepID=A0A512DF60_9CELL|nr:cysteine hydrolase family protein [Cellulomonas aerilata]GEO35124.1 cysteine hydrolase [Cellulomonas aerilata]